MWTIVKRTFGKFRFDACFNTKNKRQPVVNFEVIFMLLLIFKLLVYFCKYKENFYILLYESHLINDIVITLISHANYSFLFIKKTEGLIVLSP